MRVLKLNYLRFVYMEVRKKGIPKVVNKKTRAGKTFPLL